MRNGAGLRLLFVEDDPEQSDLWVPGLRACGFDVTLAANGASALAAAEGAPWDAVLLDIGLGPGLSGLDVAARLHFAQPSLAVIFMTAHDDADTLEHAKFALPAGFVRKPFRLADLLDAIERGTSHTMPELLNDHDLLVRLDVKLTMISEQLNEARSLVAAKADRETLEPRLAKIERTQEWTTNRMYMFLGGLAVLQLVLKFFIK